MKNNLMRNPLEELKGSIVPKHLIEEKTADDVAAEVSILMKKYRMGAWITGTNREYAQNISEYFVPSNAKKRITGKGFGKRAPFRKDVRIC
ncbi:MAG: hypothetical protein LBP82_04450 [Candidatus Methanoplasma sp.]|nr:hypothetical protein [Candidatus Methanoplasma sp.]